MGILRQILDKQHKERQIKEMLSNIRGKSQKTDILQTLHTE